MTFNALPEEERQGYLVRAAAGKGKKKGKCKAVREDAEDDRDATEKDVTEDGLEQTAVGLEGRLALEDLQVAWENVKAIVYPFIEALGRKLNMQLSCFIGGPVLEDRGRIGATFVHYGENHEPVPKEWPNALSGCLYKPALSGFIDFVRGCYTLEDQLQQSFLNDSTKTQTAVPDPNDDKGNDHVSEVEDMSDDDVAEEGGKRKRKAASEGKKKKRKKSADETEKGTGKRKKKGKGKMMANRDALLLSVPPQLPSPAPPRPPLLSLSRSIVSDDLIDPRLLNHEEVPRHMWDTIIRSGPNNPPHGQGDEGDGVPLRPSQEPPGDSGHLSLSREQEPSEKETGGKDGLPMNDSLWMMLDNLELLERSWPLWFAAMERYLGEYDFSEGWEAMLCCWTILEGRSDFEDLKGGKNALPKLGRLSIVESWIKSARKPHPEVKAKDITLFAEDWWGWWKAIQPEWRNTRGVLGPLNASHRVDTMGNWSVLDKPGQNGLLLVLACLAWWGETVFESETAEVKAGWQDNWQNTLEEVRFVITSMLKWKIVN